MEHDEASHLLFLYIKVLWVMYFAVITPYIRSCLWYFLRLPLIHTRVLSEILSSRGFHTQYIDSQFWLGNWHLWLCICLPVLLKQTLWRVLHVKSWKKDANIYNCPFADFFWTSRYREFSETQNVITHYPVKLMTKKLSDANTTKKYKELLVQEWYA